MGSRILKKDVSFNNLRKFVKFEIHILQVIRREVRPEI